MSKYGVKITNYKAGSIYEVMCGVRQRYDSQPAMLTNSLFSDFIKANGLNIHKESSTRDIICIEFTYGSRSFEQEMKHLQKNLEEGKPVEELIQMAEQNKDKYDKKTVEEIRDIFYKNGVDIRYPVFDKHKQIKDYQTIHYRMLYRTPGKAKKGSCMFIRNSLYKKAHDYLWMGLKLPKKNAPIVEIGAYSSLITSTIEGTVTIKPENILILKDVDAFLETNVVSVGVDDDGKCFAKDVEKYRLKNTLFDGQALIDSSIFPPWADGYVLLREHFTKCAAFCSNIQLFFRDYFGEDYEKATVKDMFGNDHLAKDIKMITTDNAVKWLKFNVPYEYWCEWVHANDDKFGIVKTAHPSKLGDVQRMSYQMVNSLTEDIMDDVLYRSKEYIWNLKTNDEVFFDYLKKNTNFSNDFEVLIALCERNPQFIRSDYFRRRRSDIIAAYVKNLKTGRAIQNADNLVIVGNPYAMLLHSVGEDALSDPTFSSEDGTTQCWTARFNDEEYLAEFRNPFNSRNNLGYMRNHYHEYFDKYFKLGKLCIAVNMIGTDFQDRNNGSDQDLIGSV